MKLDSIDWPALTESQARRLIGPANAREQALARVYDGLANEDESAKAAWLRAFALWENLRVFALSGVKVADPFTMYNE